MFKPPCPNIIDVEASGFGSASYPIEVGVVLHDGNRYCSLIKPDSDWTGWDHQAETVHGISRQVLQQKGSPARQVAEELNHLLQGQTVFSDGWVVDQPWMIRLFSAAGVDMQFQVSQLESIMSQQQMDQWDKTKQHVINSSRLIRHRASNDAWLIQRTYMLTAKQDRVSGNLRYLHNIS